MVVSRRTKVTDALGTLPVAREIARTHAAPRSELDAFAATRLRALLRHATERSPWHRDRLAGLLDAPLAALPVMDKASMMQHFDDAVCDRRVTLARVEAHAAALGQDDDLLDGEFRVITTSGTSGLKAFFAFDRASWRRVLAAYPWISGQHGFAPRLPRRRRIASLTAGGPLHMTHRMATSIDISLNATLRLDVTAPVAELAAALGRFRPEVLVGYPSILAALADEQRDGRLAIAPRTVLCSSEQMTAGMRARIAGTWVDPIDVYATTESGGPFAVTCPEHGRMHLREHAGLLEVVDADDVPVPDGAPGHHVLLTSWTNDVQPIIRYRLSDRVTFSPDPCPCGRATKVIAAIEGRAEDVLTLADATGRPVAVHPNHFEEPIEQQGGVAAYEVVHSPQRIVVTIVPRPRAERDAVAAGLEAELAGRLRRLGAVPPPIDVRFSDAIDRRGGKAKLVRAAAG